MIGQVQRDTKKNYQLYGRNDMIMLDEHNKIYGSLGMAEPYIVATKTGETLLLNGAKDNEPFIGLSLYGKSHQKTVAGNQLSNPELFQDNKYQNFNLNTGRFVISNNTSYWITGKIPVEPNTQYSISNENLGGAFYEDEDTPITTSAINSRSATFVTPENCHYICVNFDKRGVPFRSNVMMNKGSTLLPYEPYTGGQPSPNPDYPQEIVSVGDDGEIEVDVYGGNLIDTNKTGELNGITWTANDDGSITIDGTATNTVSIYFNSVKTVKGEKYYLFTLSDQDLTGLEMYLQMFTATDAEPVIKFNKTKNVVVKTITETVTYDTRIRIASGVTLSNATLYPMISRAELTALSEFEPYKQPQSLIVSMPNGLPGIPVSSGGNYTDENGQQWVSDEVDFKRGKYVKRVYQMDFDGSDDEVWSMYFNENAQRNYFRYVCEFKVLNSGSVISNAFIGMSFGYNLTKGNNTVSFDSNLFNMQFSTSEFNSVEEWKAFLQSTPIKVYYALATPIETDLTPEQITAYQSLHTNYPTTTVMNDEGAGMKAIYKQIENGG